MSQPDSRKLSLNTATVREKWTLDQIIEGCAGMRSRPCALAPIQVQALGLKESARLIRHHDLLLSGYCRGGMFPGQHPGGASGEGSG